MQEEQTETLPHKLSSLAVLKQSLLLVPIRKVKVNKGVWQNSRTGAFPFAFIMIASLCCAIIPSLRFQTVYTPGEQFFVNALIFVECFCILAFLNLLVLIVCLRTIRATNPTNTLTREDKASAYRITYFAAANQLIMLVLLINTQTGFAVNWLMNWTGTPGVLTMIVLPKLADIIYFALLAASVFFAIMRILSITVGLKKTIGCNEKISFVLITMICLDSWYVVYISLSFLYLSILTTFWFS
ncbi:MAG: hypothetical protein JW936_00585 [Sedimentisphaerales bacterium]|nr:hypothetical protein [Sedimentisphaerales bacterium]